MITLHKMRLCFFIRVKEGNPNGKHNPKSDSDMK